MFLKSLTGKKLYKAAQCAYDPDIMFRKKPMAIWRIFLQSTDWKPTDQLLYSTEAKIWKMFWVKFAEWGNYFKNQEENIYHQHT